MERLLPIVTFLTGLILSGVAAFYSIVGLTTIFAGVWWPIVIMGTTLEIAKLVSVSWLHRNWGHAPKAVKAYLTSAILILMFITSMGIYGFLSKAHIDQQLKLDTGISTEIPIINNQILSKEVIIKDIEKQILVIDDSIRKLIDTGKTENALKNNEQQTKKRNELVKNKDKENEELLKLKTKKVQLESEVKKVEAEVGPIKYIAEIFYDTSDTKLLDKAVRGVIIIIIIVFDPLAIFLLIAFNVSMKKREDDNLEFIEMPLSFRDPKQIRKKLRRKRRLKKLSKI